MHNFSMHHIRVTAEVQTPVVLNQHKGSAIRGALFHALRGPDRPPADGYTGFCTNKAAPSCWECPLHASCPVSKLVATLDNKPSPESAHGRYAPRPYIIRPPVTAAETYHPGDTFTFELGLCADALSLFPYVVMALERLNYEGLGKRAPANEYQRGRLKITQVDAVHPLTQAAHPIRRADTAQMKMPDMPATHNDVLVVARHLPAGGPLTLRFKTPTRLIHRGKLLRERPPFAPLLLRLITRLEHLSQQFSDTPLDLDVPALLEKAGAVTITADDTRWEELESYSTRKKRRVYISGLLGTVTYTSDDWRPFLPWLVWGSIVGVGKNTVKGDGWYTLDVGESA